MILPISKYTPIPSKPMLIYDIIFVIFLIPFIVCGNYFVRNQYDYCTNVTFNAIPIRLETWLQIDSWAMLGFAITSIVNIIRYCCSITTYCTYISWIIIRSIFILWRTAWLIIGSIIFFKYLHPNDRCTWEMTCYMFVNIIVGFIQIISTVIFFSIYRPQPLVNLEATSFNQYPMPMMPGGPYQNPMMMPAGAYQYPGQGYPIGSNQPLF